MTPNTTFINRVWDSARHIPRDVWIIFGIALIARLFLLSALLISGGESTLVWADTTRYLALAQNTLDGIGFVHKGVPDAYRAPGYPMYLMPFLALDLPLWFASCIQIVLSSLIPVGAYYLARNYLHLSRRWVLGVGIIAAIEPVQVYFGTVLLPDTLFAIFFLVSLFFVLRWLSLYDIRSAVWAGVFLGLANYFRPAGLYFAFVIVVLCALYAWRTVNTRMKLAHFGAFMGMLILVLAPWYVRNYMQFGVPDFVSASSYNLYVYGAASTFALAQEKTYEETNTMFLAQLRAEAPDRENRWSLKNVEYLEARSKEVITRYPLFFVRNYLAGLNNFLFSGMYHSLLARHHMITVPERISFSFYLNDKGVWATIVKFSPLILTSYFFLAAAGKILWLMLIFGALWGAWIYRRNPLAVLFLASFAYFCLTVISVTIGAEARQRYALNPLIILFCFALLAAAYERFLRR